MSYTPITGSALQYMADSVSANDHYVKFYASGTTTPISMATDSTGGTLLSKAQFDAQGYAINGSSAPFIPHIDQKYKIVFYPNATDADANTFANAVFEIDLVEQFAVIVTGAENVKNFSTLAAAVADTALVDGDAINLAERTTGNGGGAMWDVVLSSTVTENTYNIVQCTGVGTLSLVLREEAYTAETIKWGCLADDSTSNEVVIQAAIDHINTTYLGGTFGGKAGDVILPAGLIKHSGIIQKKGVNLIGQGQVNTILLLDTDEATGIKTPAKSSQAAADAVSQSIISGITMGIHSSLTPTATTILLDTTGMTRCTFDDLSFVVPSNVIGVDNTGNTLAGSGGPAHWYNKWNQCFVDTSGGIGVRWGDADTATEQVTAQTWIGGRIGGTSGTGLHIRGGTGNTFHGTSFEGLNSGANKTIIIGDTTGARVSTSNNMHGCYFEQVDITTYSNTNRNRRWGGFETTISETDTGTRNGRVDDEQLYEGWPRVYASGRITTPTTVNKSFNIDTGTGITKVGTGIYEIPFTTALPDTNYVALGQSESSDYICRTSTKNTGSVRLYFFDTAGAAQDPTSFVFTVTDNDV